MGMKTKSNIQHYKVKTDVYSFIYKGVEVDVECVAKATWMRDPYMIGRHDMEETEIDGFEWIAIYVGDTNITALLDEHMQIELAEMALERERFYRELSCDD